MSVHHAAVDSARVMAGHGGPDLKRLGEQAFMTSAKKAIAEQLKDPDSAQFKNLRVVQFASGALVCGEVNAKNSFGGYSGFQRFIANASRGDIDTRALGASGGIIQACGL